MSATRNVRVCRRCGCNQTKVIDCRQKSGIMRRMRQCDKCGTRWTTVEIDEWYFKTMQDTCSMAKNLIERGID